MGWKGMDWKDKVLRFVSSKGKAFRLSGFQVLRFVSSKGKAFRLSGFQVLRFIGSKGKAFRFISSKDKVLRFINSRALDKKILFPFGLVFLIVALDQFFKFIFEKNPVSTPDILGLSLEGPVKNSYLLFGLRITDEFFFTHLGLICIFLIFFFYYFMFVVFADHKKFFYLKIAGSFIFGGWLGNFIDKLQQVYVLDYIKWEMFNQVFYFNLADVFQTCGWIFLIQQLIHLRAEIFRPNERRKLVFNKFQYQILAYFTLIFTLMTVFFILLFKQVLVLFGLWDQAFLKDISLSFLMGLILALVFLYIFISIFFAYFSNKIYGPIYAFEKHIRELIGGKSNLKAFRLRKGDHFKNLEVLAKDIKEHITAKKRVEKPDENPKDN